jgi:hypothetical protein
MTDLWRDLDTGPNPPDEVYAIVENPKRTENKYEYDVEKRRSFWTEFSTLPCIIREITVLSLAHSTRMATHWTYWYW